MPKIDKFKKSGFYVHLRQIFDLYEKNSKCANWEIGTHLPKSCGVANIEVM